MVGKTISVKITDLEGTVKTSDATAAVVKDLPELVDVKQETSNQIRLVFDADSSSIDANDILVERDEDGLVIPVEKVEDYTDLDTTQILATLSSPLIDETVYNVTVAGATTSFTASVGEVASVRINTSTAEVNKPTEIEYQLLDENGINVTSTQKLKQTVRVEVTGTYKNASTSDPTAPTVTMGAIGDECEVTITYDKGTGSFEAISATKKIECIGPTADKGTIKYEKTTNINKNSGCAKFYLDGVGTKNLIELAVNEDTDNVFFAAFDDNGDAISYDQYEVESANEKVVAAKTIKDSGKFAQINLVGNEVGATQVKVIGTTNGVSKEYFMNVSVKETEKLVKVILSSARKGELSNAYDTDYYDTITAKIYDSSDAETAVYEKTEWKLLDNEKYKESAKAPAGLRGKFGWTGEQSATKRNVKAWGAAAGTYTVQFQADFADFTLTKTLKVKVTELPEAAWAGSDDPATVKYMVEVKNAKINNINKAADADNTARLYAIVNNMFAGYVRQKPVTPATVTNTDVAKVTLSNAWLKDMDDKHYDKFRTDKMAATDPWLNAAGLQAAANAATADPSKVFTTITASGAALTTTATGKLTRYQNEDDLLPATAYTKDVAGGYYTVAKGDSLKAGDIGIGKDNNGDPTIATKKEDTIINGTLKWTMEFGVKELATGTLYGFVEQDGDKWAFYNDKINAVSDKAGNGDPGYLTYVGNDDSYDYDIARPGTYKVKFTWKNFKPYKTVTANNQFEVVDVVGGKAFPKVDLLRKTTDGYDLESLKEVVKLNVDLNNNDGNAESLVRPGLIKKWDAKTDQKKDDGYFGDDERKGIDRDDTYAKYAIVEETFTDSNIKVYCFVPVGANIKED